MLMVVFVITILPKEILVKAIVMGTLVTAICPSNTANEEL